MLRSSFFLSCLTLAAVPAAFPASAGERAFPGAEGYGAGATGWRNGRIIEVTSLADDGPGSLRACAELRDTPRVCIFRVGGTITLSRPIYVQSNVYIAGQTAPGAGIQLRMDGGSHGPLVVKNATDVVVRFVRLRPGPSTLPSPTVDAITLENAQRVYIGNVSMAFATDETFNVHVSNATAADITLADSILALSLDRSTHPKGRHSKGALICSDEGPENECGRISLLRNLFAHHRDRNPDVKATGIGPVEIVNNVFFDPVSQFGEFYDLLGPATIFYVGNVALVGPSTVSRVPPAVELYEWNDDAEVRLLAEDNLARAAEGCRARPMEVLGPVARRAVVAPEPGMLTLRPLPSGEVLDAVLARAGDRLPSGRGPDPLDTQVIDDVRRCTGQVIDAVNQVGGWPVLPEVTDATRLPFNGDTWETDVVTGLSVVETWLADLAGDTGR